MLIENGKIKSTFLGMNEGGFFSCWIYIDYNGEGQGFGGYTLDNIPETNSSMRQQTEFGMAYIMEILKVVGVSTWEELPGKFIRVKKKDYLEPIISIGHIIEDKWFTPSKLTQHYYPSDEGDIKWNLI